MDVNGLRVLDAAEVQRRLPWPALIDALAEAFARSDVQTPDRLHGDLCGADAGEQRDLLVMPAWEPGGAAGVKLVTLFDHNEDRGHPRIQGLYVLFDPHHGAPVAILDAAAMTTRRTAAASALAARYLAPIAASTMLMIGSGRLARALPVAHACVRDYRRLLLWGRDPERSRAAASDLAKALPDLQVEVAEDLARAVAEADVISSAVPSLQPVIRGAWLRPGQHLDLVGSYRPDMHEADRLCLERARLFVDTRDGVFAEAGEFIDALEDATLAPGDVAADLADLAAGRHGGRAAADDITLFKSVGTALEDLTAARLALSLD